MCSLSFHVAILGAAGGYSALRNGVRPQRASSSGTCGQADKQFGQHSLPCPGLHLLLHSRGHQSGPHSLRVHIHPGLLFINLFDRYESLVAVYSLS